MIQPTPEQLARFTSSATRLAANLSDLCVPLHLSAALRHPQVLARIRGQAEAFTRAIDEIEAQSKEPSK
ncbi:MAG TPA: hypothetical protein V6D47_00345 [Oscillatoriaceae cyanobacterium]